MARSATTLVWFAHDLRLADHPALLQAIERGGAVIPVFIWSPKEDGDFSPGAASRWWLHQSLVQLNESLRGHNSRLIVRSGPALKTLRSLIEETGADAVFWSRRYEPAIASRDALIQSALQKQGIVAETFNSSLLFEPQQIKTNEGRPYQVFTAYWRRCLQMDEPARPKAAPKKLKAPARWPKSLSMPDLQLEPKINWAGGLRTAWQPGEAGARRQLQRFLESGLRDYDVARDRPDQEGTSRLSPQLHFGEISPRQVWHAVRRQEKRNSKTARSSTRFLTELGWREFAYYLLVHFPHTPVEPLRRQFAKFPWSDDQERLCAWQKGRTGYPIIDAAMRQLWCTGWMHNRLRMIVASFLIKDLLLDWRQGAAWFWDTLVDADLANNTLGWQWTAGCGADAAPYFRIFNPVSQGMKFDPQGRFVRQWIPEIARLPDRWIHSPWLAPEQTLSRCAIALGRNYPMPIVDHASARTRALAAFKQIRSRS